MPESESPPPVHAAMSRVLAELPAIGKNQRNQSQGFNFRGIDDVLNALNPLLASHGVVVVPHEVIERTTSTRQTAKGGVLYEVSLRVRYRFYGPAGDYIEAEGWGEGTDSGDKATPKAMTGAYKYVLFQAFSISTEEASQVDADRHGHEESAPALASAEVRADLSKRIAALPSAQKDKLRADWKNTLTPLGRLTLDDEQDAIGLVELYETEAAKEKEPPPAAGPADTAPAGPAPVAPGGPSGG